MFKERDRSVRGSQERRRTHVALTTLERTKSGTARKCMVLAC